MWLRRARPRSAQGGPSWVVAPEPSVDLGQALLPPPDRPREPPAAGHIVRELLGQFRALLPSGRALVVEADHSPRISLKPAVSFCAVNRSGHNRPAPAKNAGFGGALRVAKGIIQWVTWNLARFASRSIPSFASSSAAPPSRPTRFRASWTSASA